MIKLTQRIIFQFKEYFILVALVVISLFLVSISEKPQAKKLKTFALVNFAIVDEITSSVVSIFKTDVSLNELRKENADIMLKLNKIKKMEIENEELKGMLAVKDTSSYSLITTHVISKLVNRFQGNYIIDKGSSSGIQKGMPVINYKGLVGIVMDVETNFATVKTLFNSALSVAVTIQRTNVDGVLNFDGRNLLIKNIPSTYDVKVGDIIETSDFSSVFPPSVPIGIVEKKEINDFGLLHSLHVKPFADINSVNYLFVIKIVPSKQINNLEMNLIKKP